ncbi:MAG: transporter [Planctomycetes bacterium]|nr:transporter [Planctomycetota bacterium]
MNTRRSTRSVKAIFTVGRLVKLALFSSILLALIPWLFPAPAIAGETHSDSRDVFGSDMTAGWLDKPVHSHFSPLGTPLIHPFRIEPAFTNRDLLVDYKYFRRSDENEHELEMELEWTLTRRLALIFEVPYANVDPEQGSTVNGIGDIGIGPRILLTEYEKALLAFSLEIESPTGDTEKGLGRGETAIAPSFSAWLDLDNWWTASAQFGSEHEVSSSENELFFRASLIHSLNTNSLGAEHDDHAHGLPPGLLSFILEIDTTVDIAAEDSGHVETEGIFGFLYSISENADLRVGYVFPFSKSQDLNNGFTCGLIYHF